MFSVKEPCNTESKNANHLQSAPILEVLRLNMIRYVLIQYVGETKASLKEGIESVSKKKVF